MDVYSSKSPMRDEKKYNLYRISEQYTDGVASGIEKHTKETKFIVGTINGHLSIFDYGSADITCCAEILHAHKAEVTGVSCHPSSMSNFQS